MKKKKSVEDKVLIVSSILLVLTLISIFLLGKELIKQTNEANNNPDSYKIIVSIKNNVVQDTTIFVKKNDVPYSYLGKNKKDKKKQYKKINDFMTDSIPQLTQEKKVPDSLPEAVPELRNKPLRVEVRWKNSETQKESRIVSNGKVFIKKEFATEVLVDKGEFSVTYPSINKRK